MDTLTPASAAKRPEDLACERITIDPATCGGRPCVKGTRMRVTDILGMLAAGMSQNEIVDEFPYIGHDDIVACLSYGAALAEQRVVSVAHVGVAGAELPR